MREIPTFTDNDVERFWMWTGKLNRHGCRLWLGQTDKAGYGRFMIKGERIKAHRFALMAHMGDDFDNEKLVLHRCHNPSCVNPDCLYQGTHADNMRDMVEAGRSTKGETNPSAKLTELEVREIKELLKTCMKQADIARRYGVSQVQISRINTGKKWSHVV